MKRLRYTIVSLLGLAFLFSCTKIEEYDNTPTGNFKALYHIIEDKYCFFDYKTEEFSLIKGFKTIDKRMTTFDMPNF